MHITWVNHASFVVSHGDVRLISDPWLFGTAFDDSWALLSPTAFTVDDFEDITHIWLSHEHPDHFSPAVLRAIPEATRARITVMSQETRDRKVVDYCRNLGFRAVIELPSGSWFELGEDFAVLCQPAPYDDSWLAVRANGRMLLNLNDCLIDDETMLRHIGEQVGTKPDVLLTQFSYASWVGNPDDRVAHEQAATEAIEKMLQQARLLEPQTVVPFASYVWFCHDENRYLNDSVNTVATATERLIESGFEPVVLYPGDEWEVGETAKTAAALARYAEDYERCRQQDCIHSEAVAFEELVQQAEQFSQRLFAFHGKLLRLFAKAGRPQPTYVWVADLERAAALSLRDGLQNASVRRADCDVAMSSSALSYVLRNNWGGMTLIINGRYAKPPGGDFKRFERYVHLADWANHGWRMDVELASRVKRAVPFVRHAERWE